MLHDIWNTCHTHALSINSNKAVSTEKKTKHIEDKDGCKYLWVLEVTDIKHKEMK